MINRITQIHNLGIFRDFTWPTGLPAFSRYNLVYGWNGSGKSTLVKAFEILRESNNNGEASQVNIEQSSKVSFDLNDDSLQNTKIYIFNRDFISSNIRWNDTSANNIIYISSKQIDLQLKLNNLIEEKASLEHTLSRKKAEIEKTIKTYEKSFTDGAKNIREKMQALGKEYIRLYHNYNSTYLKKDVIRYKDEKSDKLSDEEIGILIAEIKEDTKGFLNTIHVAKSSFDELINKANKAITADIISSSIDEFIKDSNIEIWAKEGYKIHQEKKSSKCLYCGNLISEQRKIQLHQHFNNAYQLLEQEIDEVLKICDDYIASYMISDISDALVASVRLEYKKYFVEYVIAYGTLKKNVELLILSLKDKKNKMHTIFDKLNIDYSNNEIEELLIQLNLIISKHNTISSNFNNIQKQKAETYKKNIVLNEIIARDFFQKESEIKQKQDVIDSTEKAIDSLKGKISILSSSLSDTAVSADKFNQHLKVFLGRDEIELQNQSDGNGYKVIRKETGEPAVELSEGEKTAFALIYFLVKLGEEGNKINKTIIVIDDPISSLDTNFVLNAYSYIMSACDKCMQLFIFSHNYLFFKLIKKWMKSKITEDKITKDKVELYSFYIVANEYLTANDKTKRSAYLKCAPKSLTDFDSEYIYLYCELRKMNEENGLCIENYYTVSNMLRKFIETFTSFKYPNLIDIVSKVNKLFTGDSIDVKLQRIRTERFINYYSHVDEFDDDNKPDNILSEGATVLNDVFKAIETIDSAHYDCLQGIYKKQK